MAVEILEAPAKLVLVWAHWPWLLLQRIGRVIWLRSSLKDEDFSFMLVKETSESTEVSLVARGLNHPSRRLD